MAFAGVTSILNRLLQVTSNRSPFFVIFVFYVVTLALVFRDAHCQCCVAKRTSTRENLRLLTHCLKLSHAGCSPS